MMRHHLSIATILFSTFVVTAFFGCATISEPNAERDSLLIGMVRQVGQNNANFRTISINGERTASIQITIENMQTRDLFQAISTGKGAFYFKNLPSATYKLKDLYLQVASKNARYVLKAGWTSKWGFRVEDGVVQNVGCITWMIDGDEGQTISFDKNFDKVADSFAELLEKSRWLNRMWVNAPLHSGKGKPTNINPNDSNRSS